MGIHGHASGWINGRICLAGASRSDHPSPLPPAACPPGLTTASTSITTNDVILIKTPLLAYDDAANACACLGGGYAAFNATEIFDRVRQSVDQSLEALDAVNSFVSSNIGNPVTVWSGPRRLDNSCPTFIVSGTARATSFSDCQPQYAILCSRSRKGERSRLSSSCTRFPSIGVRGGGNKGCFCRRLTSLNWTVS